MRVLILNGASGIGKSTLVEALIDRLPQPCALLEGDDVGQVRPGGLGIARLDLIQENMAACAENFRDWGAELIVLTYVLPTRERLDRLTQRLKEHGMRMCTVGLVSSDEELLRRCQDRGREREQQPAILEHVLDCNRRIAELPEIQRLDTTGKCIQTVVEELVTIANRDELFS